MNIFAKTAMVLSFTYYALIFCYVWIGQILGWHTDVWDLFDFPTQPTSPPLWTLLVGLLLSAATLFGLRSAYAGVWAILNGGPDQDFRKLAGNLKRVALGLIGFWFGYNLMSGGMQYLITIGVQDTSGFEFGWDPLDFDIIFAIVGIAILAISKTMERAWIAEEETKFFL